MFKAVTVLKLSGDVRRDRQTDTAFYSLGYTLLCKTNPSQVRVEDGFAFFVVLVTNDTQFPKSTVSDN